MNVRSLAMMIMLSLTLGGVFLPTLGSAQKGDPAAVEDLPKVKGLKAKALEEAVKLRWKPATGIDGYRLYIKTGKGSGKTIETIDLAASKTRFRHKRLTPGKRYVYWITALLGRAEGPRSKRVAAIPLTATTTAGPKDSLDLSQIPSL